MMIRAVVPPRGRGSPKNQWRFSGDSSPSSGSTASVVPCRKCAIRGSVVVAHFLASFSRREWIVGADEHRVRRTDIERPSWRVISSDIGAGGGCGERRQWRDRSMFRCSCVNWSSFTIMEWSRVSHLFREWIARREHRERAVTLVCRGTAASMSAENRNRRKLVAVSWNFDAVDTRKWSLWPVLGHDAHARTR